jgi:sulfate transport system substrate-binding protein
MFAEHAQKVVAEEGFRPISPSVWTTKNGAFAPFKKFFNVADFGGWETVNVSSLGKDGLWARLLNPSR